MIYLADVCSLLIISMAQSTPAYWWMIITNLWSAYWILIVLILVVWIIFEIKTRNGTAHYNSENGFSPTLNRFVGGGTYFGLQAFLFFILKTIFGEGVYCFPLPYIFHLAVFLSTGLLLHFSGFWPYLKEPGKRRRNR